MKKLTITICAIITLATYQYASAALFIDYTIDTDAATAGDQGLFRMGDLDLTYITRIKSSAVNGIIKFFGTNSKIQFNINNLNSGSEDFFTITTASGQYPFRIKDNGVLALKSSGASEFELKVNNNTLEILNKNTSSTSTYSSLVFGSTNGATLTLESPIVDSTSNYSRLRFANSTVNSEITLKGVNTIEFPSVDLKKTRLIITGSSFSKFSNLKFDENSSADINISDFSVGISDQKARVEMNNLELKGKKMHIGMNNIACMSNNANTLSMTDDDCSSVIDFKASSIKYSGAQTNPANEDYITATYANSYGVSLLDSGIYSQVALIDDYCDEDAGSGVVSCPEIWAYSRLNNHDPYSPFP